MVAHADAMLCPFLQQQQTKNTNVNAQRNGTIQEEGTDNNNDDHDHHDKNGGGDTKTEDVYCEKGTKVDVSILNIGYGMGLIDKAFQRHHPSKHTIIEAHPQVITRIKHDGFEDGANGIRIIHSRWQDAIGNLIRDGDTYDCVFFDTYGEYYEDMRDFQSHLPHLLNPGGIYSFFNGLAPDNIFFQAVYARIIELELSKMVCISYNFSSF